jgi:hemolysin D
MAKSASSALALPKMDRNDREFLPAALELYETPPSPIRIAWLWFICLAFAIALAWAYFGWLEIYAVAQGRIQPSGRSKVVQPLEPGRVIEIYVENGSKVKKGDVLVDLDPTETDADREEQARELEATLAEISRRKVAVSAARSDSIIVPKVVYPVKTSSLVRTREDGVLATDLGQLRTALESLQAEYAEHVATRDRFVSSIAAREKLLALYKERDDMREKLFRTGTASRAEVLESLQQYQTLETTQVGERGQLAETEASLTTTTRKLEETTAQFIADQTQKLADAEDRADRLKDELIKAKSKDERMRITSPIAGTVQQMAVTTIGQVVTSGQSLMTIVPVDEPVEIEALIENDDIGFVEPNQDAVIKIASFPFTRYGTLAGKVIKVSRDAVDERQADALSDPEATVRPKTPLAVDQTDKDQNLVFPATVALDQQTIRVDGKDIPLSPGMAVTVEIRTGKRRAIDYLLSPLREVMSNAGHER